MRKILIAAGMLAVASAPLFSAEPALATLPQVWVSNAGTDSPTCGDMSAPCRTMQTAHNNTTPGGTIGFLTPIDSRNIFTIQKSITISNEGPGEVLFSLALGPIIEINAQPGDIITLRGLTIDGLKEGTVGLQINTAAAVHIENCVVRNFLGGAPFGIEFLPQGRSQLFISDSIILNNGSAGLTGGLLIEPQTSTASADVVINRVQFEDNVDGILIDGAATSGPGSHVIIRDSVFSGNAGNGIHAVTISGDSPAFALVEHSTIVNNKQNGILADGPGATVLLKESTISRNGTGISTTNSGQLISYGNNSNNNNIGAEGSATGFISANF